MITSTETNPTGTTTATAPKAAPQADADVRRKVLRFLASCDFCTLSTVSPAGHPHAAGVVYAHADGALWFSTLRSSRKARNIDSNGRVGVCVPFRRLPVGPPFTIHFQAQADLLSADDPEVRRLTDRGALKSITSHGELDLPDGCFVRVRPTGTIHSFGPGAGLLDLIRDPIGSGARSFRLADADDPQGVTPAPSPR